MPVPTSPPSPVSRFVSPSPLADAETQTLDEPTALYPERFVVQALLLLKSTMGDWASKSPIDVSLDFVRQFAELLVTKLLPLRAVDLGKWADDPEEWMNEEEADRWEYELRVRLQLGMRGAETDALILVALRGARSSVTAQPLQDRAWTGHGEPAPASVR